MTVPFDAIALRYDELRPAKGEVLSALSKRFKELHGIRTLLDVGCGTGRYSIPLASQVGMQIIGVDASKKMLGEARRKCSTGTWEHCKIEDWVTQTKLKAVDVVMFAYVLQFLAWPRVFEQLFRNLNPSVVVIVTYEPKVFPSALYHRFIPELVQIDQERFPESVSLIEKLRDLGFKPSRQTVPTLEVVRTARDVQGIIDKGRAQYCSTLSLVRPRVAEDGLTKMQRSLLAEISSKPLVVETQHTVIVATT
jgi:ubiquinone/menaquinone biosynthesis C-methylase UbiE